MYKLLHPTQPNSGMFAFIWQFITSIILVVILGFGLFYLLKLDILLIYV